jgi:amidase
VIPLTLGRPRAFVLAVVGLLLALALAGGASQARAAALNLETLTAAEAEQMLEKGETTSVALVQAYIARIDAISKAGPGLDVVTQLNPHVMEEARHADPTPACRSC